MTDNQSWTMGKKFNRPGTWANLIRNIAKGLEIRDYLQLNIVI